MIHPKAQALFRAQYLGQPVLRLGSRPKETFEVLAFDCCEINSTAYLLLRSIEQLTHEETGNIVLMTSYNFRTKFAKQSEMIKAFLANPTYMAGSYLLRIGILLPFTYIFDDNKPITLTPDRIIELGWAKYKEK